MESHEKPSVGSQQVAPASGGSSGAESPSPQYLVSNYLIDRLKEVGVQHVFGVPGDYGFPFMDQIEDDPGLTWVGSCNELNAAYSADGYARTRGFAVVCGSAGVLEMGGAGGIAAAFAEEVPVLVIAGFPSHQEMRQGPYIHHSLRGRFDQFGAMLTPVTAAQVMTTLDDPCRQIDQAIADCWAAKAPVYLQFTRDVQLLAAEPPASPLVLAGPRSDPEDLERFVAEVVPQLTSAKDPVILADYMVARYGLTGAVEELSNAAGFPLAATLLGRSGAIDQTRPGYLGSYSLAPTAKEIAGRVDGSDALVRVCLRPTDTGKGAADPDACAPSFIDLQAGHATVGGTIYRVTARDALERLAAELPPGPAAPPPAPVTFATAFTPRPGTAMTQDALWQAFAGFVEPDDVLAIDYGTIQAAAMIVLPVRTSTLMQTTWDAIGWTTPAVVGAELAEPGRRYIQIVGDGGFQETAQELSTTLRLGLAPITILLNNSSYQVENITHLDPRVVDQKYNTLHPWAYSELPAVLGAEQESFTARVTREDEILPALEAAAAAQRAGRYSLIEVVVAPHDVATIFLDYSGLPSAEV